MSLLVPLSWFWANTSASLRLWYFLWVWEIISKILDRGFYTIYRCSSNLWIYPNRFWHWHRVTFCWKYNILKRDAFWREKDRLSIEAVWWTDWLIVFYLNVSLLGRIVRRLAWRIWVVRCLSTQAKAELFMRTHMWLDREIGHFPIPVGLGGRLVTVGWKIERRIWVRANFQSKRKNMKVKESAANLMGYLHVVV